MIKLPLQLAMYRGARTLSAGEWPPIDEAHIQAVR
jgi:hypothetical protein